MEMGKAMGLRPYQAREQLDAVLESVYTHLLRAPLMECEPRFGN